MIYDRYSYLWPPRPRAAIPSQLLNDYESRGWVAQAKMNGTCNLTFVSPDREVTFKTRHDADHKQWSPTAASSDFFRKLPGNGWYVFVGELLHNKTPNIKDTHYVFDLLVADNDYLTSRTFLERRAMLEDLMPVQQEHEFWYKCESNIWLARNLTSDFKATWERVNEEQNLRSSPSIEGLVLKNPTSRLKVCGKKDANAIWQAKCRIEHKNYSF